MRGRAAREHPVAARLLGYGAATLLIAGMVHLGTVLFLAEDADAGAFAAVSALGQGARLKTFAGPVGDKRLAFRDPAMADAFCLFDLRDGAVEVSLPVTPLDVATLSIHDRHGLAVYALTNRSAVRGALTLTVMTPAMRAAREGDASEGTPAVAVEGDAGFVMVEALAAMPSARSAAEATARGLACRTGPKG